LKELLGYRFEKEKVQSLDGLSISDAMLAVDSPPFVVLDAEPP
jgi:hypothetical protein